MAEGDVAMYYISTDPTLNSANLHSALESLSDEELKDVLTDVSGDSRKQRIANWMMAFPIPTWEFLAGWCFYVEKEKALEETKKHFKRKLGMSIMIVVHRPCTSES